MPLDLDARQCAMLQEMGVHVWLPGADTASPAQRTPTRTTSAVNSVSAAAAPAVPTSPARPVLQPASVTSTPRHVVAPTAPTASLPTLDAAGWSDLQQAAAQCEACGLCAGRSRSTLSAPGSRADWMVVGDPPDEAEDAAGHAFAHDAGVLLDNMLAALGLSRCPAPNALPDAALAASAAPAALAYVSNVVKCRPPHGTLVQASDLAQCAAYLQREIALVQPKVILAMGRFANQLLLGETPELTTLPLGKLRGQVRHYRSIAVLPTYHPKALLRNPADKAKAWADLCLAAEVAQGLRTH